MGVIKLIMRNAKNYKTNGIRKKVPREKRKIYYSKDNGINKSNNKRVKIFKLLFIIWLVILRMIIIKLN